MDRLARDVAVDERLGQPLGHVGGPLEAAEPQRDGQADADRAASTATQARAPADLVAGPVDEQPLGRQPRLHEVPRRRHLVLGVLAQHVERAHDRGPAAASSGISKPPSRKLRPSRSSGLPAATRAGSISMPTTRTSGRTARSRSCSSTAVTGEAP